MMTREEAIEMYKIKSGDEISIDGDRQIGYMIYRFCCLCFGDEPGVAVGVNGRYSANICPSCAEKDERVQQAIAKWIAGGGK